MARPSANLRLFVAVYPPANVVQNWVSVLDTLNLPQHRLTPMEQVHLTLLFIGDTPVRQMDAVIESVQRSCAGIKAFELAAQRLIALPAEKPTQLARLVAVEADAPAPLLELQRRLAKRLAQPARSRSSKPFRPHFTMCRFAAPAKVQIDAPLPRHDMLHVSSVQLMRSTLSHEGAQHQVVQSFSLTG